jgi:hypothetical protein
MKQPEKRPESEDLDQIESDELEKQLEELKTPADEQWPEIAEPPLEVAEPPLEVAEPALEIAEPPFERIPERLPSPPASVVGSVVSRAMSAITSVTQLKKPRVRTVILSNDDDNHSRFTKHSRV